MVKGRNESYTIERVAMVSAGLEGWQTLPGKIAWACLDYPTKKRFDDHLQLVQEQHTAKGLEEIELRV